MRDLKFRAWDKSRKEMVQWAQVLHDPDDWLYELLSEPLLGDVLMQFTGTLDTKGTPIYEGDIVKNERGEIGIIKFNCGRFVSEYVPPYNWDDMEPCDGLLEKQAVLGNIYENPHLLTPNTP